MGTALRDQYSGMGVQRVDMPCPLHIVRQISLIRCKQHGKGREHALRRFVFIDIAKYLGIRNDKLRCFFQYRKRRYQLIGRHTHNQAFLIEKFAQSLHLRQNQPSLGCLDVLRHHEKHQILPVDQCPGDEAAAVILRQFADQCFF